MSNNLTPKKQDLTDIDSNVENKNICFDIEYFKKKKEEVLQYYQNNNDIKNQPFVFHRNNLINNLFEKVEKEGLVFIEAPMLKGKTILLKSVEQYIKEKSKDEINIFLFDIIQEDDYLGNYNISNISNLYTKWTQTILSNIFDNLIKNKKTKNSKDLKNFYTDTSTVKNELESNVKNKRLNYFESFLVTIDFFIRKNLGSDFAIYFIIRLDDFNSYINKQTYKKFEDDIRQLIENNEPYDTSERIKLIISTRTFPNKRPNRLVFYLNNFSAIETEQFVKESLQIKNDCVNDFYKLIYKKTKGHPWFVNRFIHLFIIKYINIEEKPKEKLIEFTNNILEEKVNWINNKVFESIKRTDFQKKIEEKVDDCITDNQIKGFLNIEAKYKKDKLTLKKYKDNSLIKEMGLINFEYNYNVEDITIKGECNQIIEEVFVNELKELLAEYEQ